MNKSIDEAEKFCRQIARSHYENFTVGSLFLPRHLKQHIYNVYAFSRIADDFADESGSKDQNLSRLENWERMLIACYKGDLLHPVFIALINTIQTYGIPIELFQSLITAFRQDQTITRYETYKDLLGYCQNSANPVGRIYLYLFELAEKERFVSSDAVCSSLQLTNFWQDITIDWQKGRIYIPKQDMDRFGCSESDLNGLKASQNFRELMRFEVDRTQKLFDSVKNLLDLLPKQAKFEIKLFIGGGEAMIESIRKLNYDTLAKRPVIGKRTKANLILKTLWFNRVFHDK